MIAPTSRFRRVTLPNILPWLILLIILSTMAAIIWGTLGFRTPAVAEVWYWFNAYSRGQSLFDPWVAQQPTRPFMIIGSWIGYQIDSNSFAGLNLYMAILFVAQGFLVYILIRQIQPKTTFLFAFTVAVLSLILPADSGLADSRYDAYHTALVCFLISICCLVDYWKTRRKWSLILMFLANALNLGIVEVTYPLVLIMPLLLIMLEPARRITRRIVRVAALWYLAPAVMLTQTLIVFAQGNGGIYQRYLLTISTQQPLPVRLISTISYLVSIYWRLFVQSWRAAIMQIDPQSPRFLAAMLIIGLCALSIIILTRRDSRDRMSEKPGDKQWIMQPDRNWIIIGLLIIACSAFPYASLTTYQAYTERVYLFPAVGAALVIATVLVWLARKGRRGSLIAGLIAVTLIGVSLQADLVDVLRTRTEAERQQGLLAQIVTQAPHLDKAKLVVILDPTHQFFINTAGTIQAMIRYVYNLPDLDVEMCGTVQLVNDPLPSACKINAHSVTLAGANGSPDVTYPLDNVVAFEYEGDNQIKLLTAWPMAGSTDYHPTAIIDPGGSLPVRVYNLFTRWPFQMQHPLNEHPTQSIAFDSASLIRFIDNPMLPLIAYGWNGNWTSSTRSTLDVWLSADQDYQLKTVISHSTVPETLKNITLTVNDQPIPLNAQTDANGVLTLTGIIPRDVVVHDLTNTRITFLSSPLTSPLAAGTGTDSHYLGFQVDQFSVNSIPAAQS